LLGFTRHSQDGARGIGEVHRRLGATPDGAVHHRQVVPLLLVQRSHRGGVDPRRTGRRRLLPARLAPHRPCPGGGRPRRSAGAPAYAWSAEILRPDVRLDPAQLLSLIGGGKQGQGGTSRTGSLASAASALAGSLLGGSQGAPVPSGGGAAALLSGPIGGILQGQATTFIETLK